MLQTVRCARQRAIFIRSLGTAVATLGVCRPTLACCASTSGAYDAAEHPWARSERQKAATLLENVAWLFEHPSIAAGSDERRQAYPQRHLARTRRLVAELAAHPIVENRTGSTRELPPLSSLTDDPFCATRLQSSHADVIAQLSTLPDEQSKTRALGIIFRTRYDDTPFMSAKDLFSALPLGDPRAFVSTYLATLPMQIYRL